MSDSAVRLLPIRPALVLADTPDPAAVDGVMEVEFVVPEPGRWKFRLEGYAERPTGVASVHDPRTGNWLVSRLVNAVTGESVDPLTPSALRYGAGPAPR